MQGPPATLDRSDRMLVDLARHGDNEAFGELVRRHYCRCVDVAASILHNHCDAEDQVQAALLKTYTRLYQYHGEAEFATWLFRIVTNECLMFRRKMRRARFFYFDDTSCRSFELLERRPNPEDELATSELKQVLAMEVRCVPPLLRNVITRRYIQELPIGSVADSLQISAPAAKSRLLRARTELRLRLRQQGILSPLSASAWSRVSHLSVRSPRRSGCP